LIDIVGGEHLERTCTGIGGRCRDLAPVFAEAVPVQERAELPLFAEKYVLTGALRDSLTSSHAEGAVRRVTESGLEFGSGIYYARFQVEDPGPETAAGGLERRGHPSAVLKLSPELATGLTADAGEYVMRGLAL
jgi:hypothetical protein